MPVGSESGSNFEPDSAEDEEQTEPGESAAHYEVDHSSDARPISTATPGLSVKREKAYLKARRLAHLYNPQYINVLNENILSAAAPFIDIPSTKVGSSYIGGSIWSSSEKGVLFEAVARYGRDDLPRIADAVGTKSAVECRAYLLTLRRGLVEHSLNAEENQLLGWVDLPGAVEVSQSLTERLELSAEAVSARLWSTESKREKERWGATWRIDYDLASELDAVMSDEGRGRKRSRDADDDQPDSPRKRLRSMTGEIAESLQSDEELQRSAELFQSRAWIALQHNVFMNAGGARTEENWLSIATESEEPSIMRTAYTDFYRLARALTQRLVQAALMQATSRQRATHKGDSIPRRHEVERVDVVAALTALNMPLDSHNSWVYTPRRTGVQVLDDTKRTSPDALLSYDEVEEALSGLPTPKRQQSDGDSDTELLGTTDIRQEAEDEMLEMYADELDGIASAKEEHMLLGILGDNVDAYHEPNLPQRPPLRRKLQTDLVDWRDWTDYRAMWDRGAAAHAG